MQLSKLKLIFPIAAILIFPNFAIAQMPMNNPVLDNVEFGRQIKSITDQGQPKKDVPQNTQPDAIMLSSLIYEISFQRRQDNYRSYLKKTQTVDPTKAVQAKTFLKNGDVIEIARPTLQKKYGLKIDNIADAYTMWKIAAWMTANQSDITITTKQTRAVQAQMASEFSQSTKLLGSDDAFKQFFAESLWLDAFLINEANRLAGNDVAARKQLALKVMESAKRDMNIDLSAITLTDSGFVPRKSGKRGDAGEAMEGAEPGMQGSGALASAAPSPSSGGMDGADIALLIAAVSAGAGGIFMIGKGISNQRQG
jgi:hypothetical protein